MTAQTQTAPSAVRPVPSLKRNFGWTFLGNSIYAASQWGMVTCLAKMGSPAIVGQFALAIAIATPIITFANMALRQVQATDAQKQYQFGDYLALRLLTSLIAPLLIALIALKIYPLQTALVVAAMGVARAVEAVSDVYFGLLQQRERMDRIAISMIIKGFLSLGAVGTIFAVTHSVLAAVVGLTVVWSLVLFFYDIPSGHLALADTHHSGEVESPRPRWKPAILRELTLVTLPLGFTMMFIMLNANVPRYFVEKQGGTHALGVFAAMAYVLVLGTTVVGALGQSASPRLAKLYAANDAAAFRLLLARNTLIAGVLGGLGVLIALVAGKPILTLLYKPEYALHADVFLWLNIAGALHYVSSALAIGVTASRQYRVQPLIYGSGCAATALACLLLVPRYGLLGAAWAFGIPAVVQIGAILYCNRLALQQMRLSRRMAE